jgi:glycine/D-amino acid oxidase-like deaminating enzyme
VKSIGRVPHDDTTNGWSKLLAHRQPKPPLRSRIVADWVVVGAGLAGLSAARRLAENRPDDRIALVDASTAGENASGRNSGFAIGVSHNQDGSPEQLEKSRRHIRLVRAAIDYNEQIVERHGIPCDWNRCGKYHAAVTQQATDQVLLPLVNELEALNEPYQFIAGDKLTQRIGTPHFTAAVYTPGCVLLNPAALCRGLADTLPPNVALYERTPVTGIDYAGCINLTTAEGEVRAPRMILTVNGCAPQFGFFERRLLSFAAHASLSRPMTQDERNALGGEDEWGLIPTHGYVGITMRRTRDHRILVRENVRFCPDMNVSDAKRQAIKREHQKLFDQRFPMLPNVTMEHTWTGYVCASHNGSPGFGQVGPNVYAAVCQNGGGVTRGTIAGILAADKACGVDNPLVAEIEKQGTPDRVPARPFVDLGVHTKLAWDRFVHRAEA